MIIGCVKEIKKLESRVGLTPSAVHEYCNHGHKVFIESEAGINSGFTNEDYINAGAEIKEKAAEVGELCEKLKGKDGGSAPDQRWVATGKTDLQKGFMALTRSIAKPEFF